MLSTLSQELGLPTVAKEARQSDSVDYAVINLECVGIYASSLSVIPAIVQTCRMKGTRWRLSSLMVSNSVSIGKGAHPRDIGDMTRSEISSSNGVRSSSLVVA